MNFIKCCCLGIAMSIVGCAYHPAPYQVVDSLPYKRGYMSGFYKEGVTEEVVKAEHYYKITVRLDNGSSKARAKNMLLYHTAKLAQANGVLAFTIKKINNSVWCSYSKFGDKNPYIADSGSSASAFITLIQPTTPEEMLARPTYQAAEMIAQYEHNVLQGESKADAVINRKANEEECKARFNDS
ncbi:hypothetical protein [Thalassotalea agariperforans]